MSADRIEKRILLRASRDRVWRALTDHTEFETWFGFRFDGPFKPGALMRGVIVGSQVNREVGDAQRVHVGKAFEITIDRIEPQRLFSFRWHPHAIDPSMDYSAEPMTLIEFVLEEVPEGVMLTVSESGFDRIPLSRRAEAFKGNDQGWGIMTKVLEEYVGAKPKAVEAR
jgi:uncharacterized protein YndB with AHSA1/START domain